MILLSACGNFTDLGESYIGSELEQKIYAKNEEGYRLNEEGKPTEAIEALEEAIEYIYELEPGLENLDHEVERTELIDSPFNNIAWAYNELGQYELGLEYIGKSLLILPNTSEEYNNKGNVLYGLDRYEEAMAAYDQALTMDSGVINANYGKGLIYYDQGEYEKALGQFETYLKAEPGDAESAEMKIYCLQALDRGQEALKYADGYFAKHEDVYDGYRVKGTALEGEAEYEEVEDFYLQMAGKFPDQLEPQLKLGDFYYNYGEYDEAASQYKKLEEKYPDTISIRLGLIKTYSSMGDLDSVQEAYKDAPEAAEIHTAVGNAYLNNGLYTASVPYFEKAIEMEPENQEGYISKLKALNWGKRYSRCAVFGEKAMTWLTPATSDIPWYTGECQSQLGQDLDAQLNFRLAAEIDPEDYEAWSYLATAYLALGEPEEAEEASNRALEIYSEDSMALYVKDSLEERKKPLGERIGQFFRDNYLYGKNKAGMDDQLAVLKTPGISEQQIAAAIDKAKLPEDKFTFMAYGELYDLITEAQDEEIEYKDMGDLQYFKIDSFTRTTDDQFIRLLDEIPAPAEKTLVIDLRGNGGGLTDSANNMLDALLPDLVTSTLIYSDGYTYNYYSDPEHVDFRSISIFVDENTASAAELLTLGLKTYLNNVTVLGRQTFGKGVGQQVFEDKEHKVMVYAVNHYWNVRQNNISDKGIAPDIEVKGDELDSFMKKVQQ
ncbi:S41 family peptidase [Paenibacillus sp. M1]|uniref:S41 family peptidase n=2 Tax=Paenibacillus haidiansis TaxID=1574488 RepID=A0ABU7VV18_9BACL